MAPIRHTHQILHLVTLSKIEDLRGQHFPDDIDLLRAVHKSLALLAKNGFDAVFQRWVHRGGKCAEINGNYVEKVVSFSGQLI